MHRMRQGEIAMSLLMLVACGLLGAIFNRLDPNTKLDKIHAASPWIYDEDEEDEDTVVTIH